MDPLQPWLDAKEVRRLAEGLLAPPPEVEESAVDAAYGEVFEGFATKGEAEVANGADQAPKPVTTFEHQKAGSSADVQETLRSGDLEKKPEPAAPAAAKTDSPFQISADQNHLETDIIAAKRDAQADDEAPDHEKAPDQPPTSPSPDAKSESVSDEENDEELELKPRGPFLSRISQFSQIIRRDMGARAMFLIDVNGQILFDEVENPKLIQVARTLANASQRANRQSAGAAAVGNLHVKIGASSTLEVIPVDSRYGLLILGVIFSGPIGALRVMQVADELHRTIEPGN
ncbi:MAG: hypothetical protein ACPH5P_05940 [Akkermansiaceae bacterium]